VKLNEILNKEELSSKIIINNEEDSYNNENNKTTLSESLGTVFIFMFLIIF